MQSVLSRERSSQHTCAGILPRRFTSCLISVPNQPSKQTVEIILELSSMHHIFEIWDGVAARSCAAFKFAGPKVASVTRLVQCSLLSKHVPRYLTQAGDTRSLRHDVDLHESDGRWTRRSERAYRQQFQTISWYPRLASYWMIISSGSV
jgi:hypothetical protein